MNIFICVAIIVKIYAFNIKVSKKRVISKIFIYVFDIYKNISKAKRHYAYFRISTKDSKLIGNNSSSCCVIVNKNRGVSLIELMIAISILAILTTVATQSFGKYQAEQKLRYIAQQFNFGLQKGLNISMLSKQELIFTSLYHQSDLSSPLIEDYQLTKQYWQAGWSMFSYNNNVSVSEQSYQQENLLASFKNNNQNSAIKVLFQSSLNKPYVLFYSSGELWPYGRFIFCHEKYNIRYEIAISQWGDFDKVKKPQKCD